MCVCVRVRTRVCEGLGGGSAWLGWDWILLCAEDVPGLRLGPGTPAQSFLGNNEDLLLAPLLPLL